MGSSWSYLASLIKPQRTWGWWLSIPRRMESWGIVWEGEHDALDPTAVHRCEVGSMEKVCLEPVSPRSFSPTPLKTAVAAHSFWSHNTVVRAPLLLPPSPSVTWTPGGWGQCHICNSYPWCLEWSSARSTAHAYLAWDRSET